MEYRLTIAIEGLGSPEVAEDNAEAMLDAFDRAEPSAGAAVGADLAASELEITFSVEARSPDDAWARGARVFVSAASQSGIEPAAVTRVDFEPLLDARTRIPLRRRTRGAGGWSLPDLARV